jgi:CBS domain-containing protein
MPGKKKRRTESVLPFGEEKKGSEMNQDMVVADCMDKDFITFHPELPMREAMSILLKKHLRAALVVDDEGLPVGLLAENDCLKVLLNQAYYNQEPEDTVKNYMQKVPEAIPPSTHLLQAADIFLKNVHRRVPVMESGKLVGQITRRDLLKAMHTELFSKK